MSRFMHILFWISVIMLVDAAIDLWGLPFWQRLVPGFNVKKIAFYEILAALFLLIVFFIWRTTQG